MWAAFGTGTLTAERALGARGLAALLAGVVCAAALWGVVVLLGRFVTRVLVAALGRCERVSVAVWLAGCIALATALRLAWVAVLTPLQASDMEIYFELARSLAEQGIFQYGTDRVYMPPGLPLVLAPAVKLFGPAVFVPFALNLLLTAGTILVTAALARVLADERVGRLATALLAIWPNLIFLSGLASKELLVLFLLPLAVLIYLGPLPPSNFENPSMLPEHPTQVYVKTNVGDHFDDREVADIRRAHLRRSKLTANRQRLTAHAPLWLRPCRLGATDQTDGSHWRSLAAGLAFGGAALTQPNTLVLLPAFAAFELLRSATVRGMLVRMGLLLAGTALVVSPWTIRNYLLFQKLVPISANFGHSLLVGNHAGADGGFQPVRDSYVGMDEIAYERMARAKAWEWIRANPREFVRLVPRKQMLFLGDDADGAYHALKWAYGIADTRYVLAKGASNAFWLGVLALIAISLRARQRNGHRTDPRLALLMLFWFCLLALLSVTESGARHHIPLSAFAAILASLAASLPARRTRAGERPVRLDEPPPIVPPAEHFGAVPARLNGS